MATLRKGARGPEVERVQRQLAELGHYDGPEDGVFDDGVEAAVRAFQQAEGLEVDGLVGSNTADVLFAQPSPLLDKPLDLRCLALTAAFETSTSFPDCFCATAGDFDGQGISFGVLQWNFGQGTLQPMLQRMAERHGPTFDGTFGSGAAELRAILGKPRTAQLEWTRTLQRASRRRLDEPWRGFFHALGRTAEFQDIQREAAADILADAKRMAAAYGLTSERGLALMFDIRVQNGSIPPEVKRQIERDIGQLPAHQSREDGEVARMRIIANRRAEAARAEFVDDVRRRKLTIADGKGTVHGKRYDLERQFGIGLRAHATA
jgi:hypothetical protein